MRIIGGKYRGRILKMPKGVKIRPTQDKVREAVFNIIKAGVPEARVLDLYAGSGAFGIEALSRGAYSSIFVDNNIKCIRAIKSNLLALGDSARLEGDRPKFEGGTGLSSARGASLLVRLDGVRSISRFKRENKKFDIIFLDPPYHEGLARNCLIKIDACDILSQRGFAICEHFKKDIMPERIGNLLLFKNKRYGDTVLSFYRREK
ncbi:MAG: 16S rRNA (guanine(966)-N(2))-methyltransferase RsmD [Candidatus Omnitrophota bacterium]|nr:MAG: 16S rRNA (guanine(966)-N(2))-methyltransferase RsmD [Candidatus Omnitrophota bacterium]